MISLRVAIQPLPGRSQQPLRLLPRALSSLVRSEFDEGTGAKTLTMTSPKTANALSLEMLETLTQEVECSIAGVKVPQEGLRQVYFCAACGSFVPGQKWERDCFWWPFLKHNKVGSVLQLWASLSSTQCQAKSVEIPLILGSWSPGKGSWPLDSTTNGHSSNFWASQGSPRTQLQASSVIYPYIASAY